MAEGVAFHEYDPKNQLLAIRFDGGEVYLYSGVPQDVADGMKWATAVGVSAGNYFHKYIRDKYRAVKH